MPAAVKEREPSCAWCGACTVVCPVFRVDGRESLTARGKMRLLATELAGHPSAIFQDIFSRCLLCGACENTCPRHLPIRKRVIDARSNFPALYGRHGLRKTLARLTLSRSRLLDGLVRAGIGLQRIDALPADSGLRLKLGLLEKRPLIGRRTSVPAVARNGQSRAHVVSYFTGCLACYLQPSVAEATVQLAGRCTGSRIMRPEGQGCCGLAALAAGQKDEARQMALRNMEAFAGTDGPILTSCATCSSHLVSYPDLFRDDRGLQERAEAFAARVKEFSAFFLAETADLCFTAPRQLRVFYHDPCHLRFSEQGRTAPRNLLAGIRDIRLLEPAGGPNCCGQGGLFHLGYPELSMAVFARALDAALTMEPELVVTTCSGCLMQWQQGVAAAGRPVRVLHLAKLLQLCLPREATEAYAGAGDDRY